MKVWNVTFYYYKVAYIQYLGKVDIIHTSKKILPVYNSAKIIKKTFEISQSYDHKCTATFLWFTVCNLVSNWPTGSRLKSEVTSGIKHATH